MREHVVFRVVRIVRKTALLAHRRVAVDARQPRLVGKRLATLDALGCDRERGSHLEELDLERGIGDNRLGSGNGRSNSFTLLGPERAGNRERARAALPVPRHSDDVLVDEDI
eukprot:Amastigsp_a844514_142.p7 type:complete len:112 gc:universal Amastigsp_a844514_142:1281-946(-)